MWPPTGLIPWFSKTEGNTYAALLHHPFLFKGKPTQCSRGNKKDFLRRCRGGSRKTSQDLTPDNEPFLAPLPGSLRKSQHTKYPSQTLFSRITLFAICLSFSSPPLHPCHFIRPLSLHPPSLSLFASFCPFLVCLCVRLLACRYG